MHVKLLLELIRQSQDIRSNIIVRLLQEQQKVAEVRVETPYEARLREQREAEAKEKGEEATGVDTESMIGKEKTPEEIALERAKLAEQAQAAY